MSVTDTIRSLTKKQRAVLDQIACNNDGGHHPATVKVLVTRGLIEARSQQLAGWPPMSVLRYDMPIYVHIAWCQLCSEEIDARGGIEVVEAEMERDL